LADNVPTEVTEHVMLDLETLGTTPGCAVLSVGACSFTRHAVQDKFYQVVRLDENCGAIDPYTVTWWMKQSDAARAVFLDRSAQELRVALRGFRTWFLGTGARYLWCHGATFDAPIIENRMEAVGVVTPWKYWDVRDTRTLFDLVDVSPSRDVGTHHNALDDAVAQAEAVIEAWRKLR
jgi:hypothetical protein